MYNAMEQGVNEVWIKGAIDLDQMKTRDERCIDSIVAQPPTNDG